MNRIVPFFEERNVGPSDIHRHGRTEDRGGAGSCEEKKKEKPVLFLLEMCVRGTFRPLAMKARPMIRNHPRIPTKCFMHTFFLLGRDFWKAHLRPEEKEEEKNLCTHSSSRAGFLKCASNLFDMKKYLL
jgi:hypothetical protein